MMMKCKKSYQFLVGNISGTFFTIGNTKIMTFCMNTIFTHFTTECTLIFDSFSANVTKFTFHWTTISPTMWNRILELKCNELKQNLFDKFDCLDFMTNSLWWHLKLQSNKGKPLFSNNDHEPRNCKLKIESHSNFIL